MSSNSGCTDVLVEGTSTANFLRHPSASGIALFRRDRELEGRLLRRGKARFLLAGLAQRRDRSAEVEDLHLAALLCHAGVQLLGGGGIDRALGVEQDAVVPCTVARHQPAPYLLGDQRRIARERIAPSAAAPGDVVEKIARMDFHAVAPRRK